MSPPPRGQTPTSCSPRRGYGTASTASVGQTVAWGSGVCRRRGGGDLPALWGRRACLLGARGLSGPGSGAAAAVGSAGEVYPAHVSLQAAPPMRGQEALLQALGVALSLQSLRGRAGLGGLAAGRALGPHWAPELRAATGEEKGQMLFPLCPQEPQRDAGGRRGGACGLTQGDRGWSSVYPRRPECPL